MAKAEQQIKISTVERRDDGFLEVVIAINNGDGWQYHGHAFDINEVVDVRLAARGLLMPYITAIKNDATKKKKYTETDLADLVKVK